MNSLDLSKCAVFTVQQRLKFHSILAIIVKLQTSTTILMRHFSHREVVGLIFTEHVTLLKTDVLLNRTMQLRDNNL